MILRDSVFEADPWGGGGQKRTAQISEILARNGLEDRNFVNCPQLIFKSPAEGGDPGVQLHVLDRTLRLPIAGERGRELIRHINRCKQVFLDMTGGNDCLLWENTRPDNYLTITAAQQAGLSTVALPHNLESLVPSQRSTLSGRSAPDYFEEELAFLAVADHVFAISREEQWLLRLHGIDADYLPYYPPGVIIEYLSGIRARRQQSTRFEGYLLLGSANNPPTMQGMVELIRCWPKTGHGKALHVAGYATENLDEVIHHTVPESPEITLHGTVSNDLLAELMESVQAVILNQPPTTGALTRIPEMLLAGVPLLANRNAARNVHHTDGLHIYDDLVELQSMLASSDLTMPSPPPEPKEHEARFIRSLLKVIDEA